VDEAWELAALMPTNYDTSSSTPVPRIHLTPQALTLGLVMTLWEKYEGYSRE